MKPLFACIAAMLLFASCAKEEERDPEPKIRLEGVTPTQVKQGNGADTIIFSLHVEDGDADLYNDGETQSVFLRDTFRIPAEPLRYATPIIPEVLLNPKTGFSGTIIVSLPAAFLSLKDSTNASEPMRYEIYIKDKAGNISNVIYTPTELTLLK